MGRSSGTSSDLGDGGSEIFIGGLGSVLGSVLGAMFATLLPIVIRFAMGVFGGVFLAPQTVLNLIRNLS